VRLAKKAKMVASTKQTNDRCLSSDRPSRRRLPEALIRRVLLPAKRDYREMPGLQAARLWDWIAAHANSS